MSWNLEHRLKWRRALNRAVSSLSAVHILLFCSSFFTSHSLFRLLLRSALLPSQARAGLCLVSCVLRKQTNAVPKPLCSTYSQWAKYLQGSIRQTKTPASKINWSVSFSRQRKWGSGMKKVLKMEKEQLVDGRLQTLRGVRWGMWKSWIFSDSSHPDMQCQK